jgi:hypothetical protein
MRLPQLTGTVEHDQPAWLGRGSAIVGDGVLHKAQLAHIGNKRQENYATSGADIAPIFVCLA